MGVMKFELKKNAFLVDGKPVFLLSGEVHYFRTPPETWDTHLEKLKACGAQVVSSYVPWSWHEIEPGVHDFDGHTDGNRNLKGWLDAVARHGLLAVVKPGPYVLAEYDDQGIPPWVRHAEGLLSREADMLTYMHPRYLELVAGWYDVVFPVLRPYQVSEGGPIAMMQLCNEIGLFNWLAGKADDSPTVRKRYRVFLEERFGTVEELNRVHGTRYAGFSAVRPPTGKATTPQELARWMDFHEFHRVYFADYLEHLEAEARARGITVPFYHNIAGWVYGHALEYPVDISMYRAIARRCPDTLLAADHIPENVSYRNAHHGSLVTKAIAALKGGEELSYVAEMQAGTREDCVTPYPVEMELFYKKCLAEGTQGMNLYMFSQGKNPHRRGAFGPMFYWHTALDHRGEELPLYPTLQRLGNFLQNFGTQVVQARRRVDTAVAFYWPYWQTEFLYPVFERKCLLDAGKAGLDFDPKSVREAVLVENWLKLLGRWNVEHDIVDLETVSADRLASYGRVLVLTLPFMDGPAQAKLLRYVEQGGNLFFTPSLPRWDCKFEPAPVLARGFGLEAGEKQAENKFDALGYEYLACLGPLYGVKGPQQAMPVALCSGSDVPCGLSAPHGKGSYTYLSALFPHMTEEHAIVLRRLALGDTPAGVQCDHPGIMTSCIHGEGASWLFAGNVHSEPVAGRLTVAGLEGESIPLALAPKASLFAPVRLPLPGGGTLVFSTADVIRCEGGSDLEFDVYREAGARSEMLFELPFVPAGVSLDHAPVEHSSDAGGRVRVKLAHRGKVQVLRLTR